MEKQLISWDIYEVSSAKSSLKGVMLRGRIRKLGLENNCTVLTENTQDIENGVRFAVIHQVDPGLFSEYIKSIIPDATVELVAESVVNPVLSKLKVNIESRYTL